MTWTCVEYECWLDDGRPGEGRSRADAHVTGCRRCGAALAAACSVEAALALPSTAAAPVEFTDMVMRRVSLLHATTRTRVLEEPAPPWWMLGTANPVAVALVAPAALLVWQSAKWWADAAGFGPGVAAWGHSTSRWLAAAIEIPAIRSVCAVPAVPVGLALAGAPLLLWLGCQLARWSEQAVTRSLIRLAPPR